MRSEVMRTCNTSLYPIHVTLCSDVTRKPIMNALNYRACGHLCLRVYPHDQSLILLACVNTVPITDLRAYVTAQTSSCHFVFPVFLLLFSASPKKDQMRYLCCIQVYERSH